MTGAVHASIGAAIGALTKRPRVAFITGIVSHVIADAIPHKDLSVKKEVILLAVIMAGIASRYGLNSPQFWGAAGAVCPDCEHGLLELGLIKPENEIFPTHLGKGKYHGPQSNERISQVIIFILGMILAESGKRKQPEA